MPIAPLTLTIGAFTGEGEGENRWSLPASYSAQGSQNLYIDKLGRIRLIDGFSRLAQYRTNTFNALGAIRGMYQYNRITSGSGGSVPGALTPQILFTLDDTSTIELWYSTDLGFTGTFIANFGALGTKIPDFTTFGDQCFITIGGTIAPRMWDGTTLTTAGSTQLAAPTSAVTAIVGLLNGIYTYRLVPIKGYVGSVPQRKVGSVPSTPLAVQNLTVLLGWTADADVAVTGYELYRTSGSGLDLYLVAYIDGRLTVAYTDVLPDRELLTHTAMALVAAVGDPPPVGTYFCVPHKGRVFWLATDTFPRRGWWSDPGVPASVYTDRSFTDFTDGESLGDRCVGGTGEFQGMLVVWLQKSIWTISGTGQVINGVTDWRKKRTSATIGAVHHRATARVPNGAIFTDQKGDKQSVQSDVLAYLTPAGDIRLFDGISDTIISFPVKDTLSPLVLGAPQEGAFCYVDEQHGMIVWCIFTGLTSPPVMSIAWNYWFGTWHIWPGTPFLSAVARSEIATTGSNNIVLAGGALGVAGATSGIYRLWSGSHTQNGATITGTLLTKPIFPPLEQAIGFTGSPDMTAEKRLEAMLLLFTKDTTPETLTVSLYPYDAAEPGDATPATITRTIAGGSRVRVPAQHPAADANAGQFFFGPGWRLALTSAGAVGPWTLESMQFVYLPLPGKTR